MDDYAAEILANERDEAAVRSAAAVSHAQAYRSPRLDDDDFPSQSGAGTPVPSTPQRTGFRSGFAALRDRANIQDRLVEKLLGQVIPTDDHATADAPILQGEHATSFAQRPNFNITTMSNNFRRFNARIGVVFKFQARAIRLFSWRRPSHTLSFLAVYSFMCLDPYMLSILPIFLLLLGVLIPAFLARHPAPPKGTLSSEQNVGYSPRGPPLAPAATVKPAKELSKDFFRNMRDLQNCMDDFSRGHDQVVSLMVPVTNFSDEALSSVLFQALLIGGVCMMIAAHLLPWRLIFLVGGWVVIVLGHPSVSRQVQATHSSHLQTREKEAKSWLENWVATDMILDSAPETREVEIFELQKMSSAGEWEPWLFSPQPYDPLSQPRIAGERPSGTRFFEDVAPPEGWEWSEKKWALDLWSREWVEERIITGVEVETEGERWVYDIYEEKSDQVGVVDASQEKGRVRAVSTPSWEEGEDGSEKKGDWRRRRWVRLVKRRVTQVEST